MRLSSIGYVPSIFVLCLAALLAAPASAAPAYTIVDLGTLGGPSSEGNGINGSGHVTGDSGLAGDDGVHAFKWVQGVKKDLGTLGGEYSVGNGIDPIGRITGYATLPNGHYRAFVWDQGRMSSLGDLGGDFSAGYAIDSGWVVGMSKTAQGKEHAFLYSSLTGVMQDLGTLGGQTSQAYAVNAQGTVVGYAYDLTWNFVAFRWSAGNMVSLGTLGGDWSKAFGINGLGTIVGQAYTTGNFEAHAFRWTNGTLTDLGRLSGHYSEGRAITNTGMVVGQADVANDTGFLVYHAVVVRPGGHMQDLNGLIPAGSGWTLSEATAINESGQISGYGTFNGAQHAFLLIPKVTLSLAKSSVPGAIEPQWGGGPAPYTLMRATNARFTENVQTLVGNGGVTSFDDPVLSDGQTYFYLVN
jgi:probable HAF family extracellular repeat protein